jgi:hypothetical protein
VNIEQIKLSKIKIPAECVLNVSDYGKALSLLDLVPPLILMKRKQTYYLISSVCDYYVLKKRKAKYADCIVIKTKKSVEEIRQLAIYMIICSASPSDYQIAELLSSFSCDIKGFKLYTFFDFKIDDLHKKVISCYRDGLLSTSGVRTFASLKKKYQEELIEQIIYSNDYSISGLIGYLKAMEGKYGQEKIEVKTKKGRKDKKSSKQKKDKKSHRNSK